MQLDQKHIFVVEDNPLNRMVYTVILHHLNIIAQFDRWGRHTLDQLDVFHPDLIILDLMLPSAATGFRVFEEIHADPRYAHVPIIAVSAYEPSIAIPRCQTLGFAGFIAKPIIEEKFAVQLEHILRGEPVWDAGEQRF